MKSILLIVLLWNDGNGEFVKVTKLLEDREMCSAVAEMVHDKYLGQSEREFTFISTRCIENTEA